MSLSVPVCLSACIKTYLVSLQPVDDDSDEEDEGEEAAEDEETDEVQMHVRVVLIDGLRLHLQKNNSKAKSKANSRANSEAKVKLTVRLTVGVLTMLASTAEYTMS